VLYTNLCILKDSFFVKSVYAKSCLKSSMKTLDDLRGDKSIYSSFFLHI